MEPANEERYKSVAVTRPRLACQIQFNREHGQTHVIGPVTSAGRYEISRGSRRKFKRFNRVDNNEPFVVSRAFV